MEFIKTVWKNKKMIVQLGKNARDVCEKKYDSSIINHILLKEIESN